MIICLWEKLQGSVIQLNRSRFVLVSGIETSDPNAVVIGLAPDHFNYETLNKAFK